LAEVKAHNTAKDVSTNKAKTALTANQYKKLRYREDHSASVVLSWCRPIL